MEVLEHKPKSLFGVLVALDNCEVHVYVDKMHVDTIVTEDVVTAMKFGRFGREESTLVMITRGWLSCCIVCGVSDVITRGRSSL